MDLIICLIMVIAILFWNQYSVIWYLKKRYKPKVSDEFEINEYVFTKTIFENNNYLLKYENPIRLTCNDSSSIDSFTKECLKTFESKIKDLTCEKKYKKLVNISDISGLDASKSVLGEYDSFSDFFDINEETLIRIESKKNFDEIVKWIEIRHQRIHMRLYADVNKIFFMNCDASHRFIAAYNYAEVNNIDYFFDSEITEYSFNPEVIKYFKENWYMFILPNELNNNFLRKFLIEDLRLR